MLLLEGYISNFTRARYYFLCVEFSDFYVNQSLAGQTILPYPARTVYLTGLLDAIRHAFANVSIACDVTAVLDRFANICESVTF
jgi:hypothetical protein